MLLKTQKIAALLLATVATNVGIGESQMFLGAPAQNQIEAARKSFPGVKLELVVPKTRYEVGEPIEAVMRYENGGNDSFIVRLVSYDRSGRILIFGFSAANSAGKAVRDPFQWKGGIAGGLSGSKKFAPNDRYEQSATVNEWLAFDEPGQYQLTAWSGIVQQPDKDKAMWGEPVVLQSAPLLLEIVAPDEKHRLAGLQNLEKSIATGSYDQKRAAARELRWMLDERAIPLLVPLLESDGLSGFQAQRGLAAFQDQKPVVAALLKRLDEPRAITEGKWGFNSLLPAQIPWGADAPPGVSATLEVKTSVRLEAKMRAALREAETARNPTQAANFLADLLSGDLNTRDASLWTRFWENAALASPEKQNAVAFHLKWEAIELKNSKKLFATSIADLQRAVADTRLQSELRSSAILALQRRGDRSFLPLLARDALQIKPVLSGEVLALLGNYEARPRALALLERLRAPDAQIGFDRRAVAARVRDLGEGATLPELVAATRALLQSEPYQSFPLIEAAALQSQTAAVPLLRAYTGRVGVSGTSDEAARLLVRLQTPQAREMVLDWLKKRNQSGFPALAVLSELSSMGDEIAYGNPVGNVGYAGERHLKANASWTFSFVPALLQLWDETSNPRQRADVTRAIYAITRLPNESLQPSTPEKEAKWRVMWANWKPQTPSVK